MSKRKKHNPEKRAFKGRSHKKGGTRVKAIKEKTFSVEIKRTLVEAVCIEVQASNEDDAANKAEEIARDDAGILEWEFQDDDMVINQIERVE